MECSTTRTPTWHQLWTLYAQTEVAFVYQGHSTTAHCDTLIYCALEIFLLTYLQVGTYTGKGRGSGRRRSRPGSKCWDDGEIWGPHFNSGDSRFRRQWLNCVECFLVGFDMSKLMIILSQTLHEVHRHCYRERAVSRQKVYRHYHREWTSQVVNWLLNIWTFIVSIVNIDYNRITEHRTKMSVHRRACTYRVVQLFWCDLTSSDINRFSKLFHCQFSIVAWKTLDISQGSVATHLRCGGIFSDSIITHFLPILTVK